MLLMFLIGAAMVAIGTWTMKQLLKLDEKYERYLFERRNEFGVLVLESFEEKKKIDRWNNRNGLIGAPLVFLSCALIVIGVMVTGIPVVQYLRS